MSLNRRRIGAIVVAGSTALALGTTAAASVVGDQADRSGTAAKVTYAKKAKNKKYVKLDVLAINDFHGHLEPPTGSSGQVGPSAPATNTRAGGVAYLARLLKQERKKSRAAGATPLTVAAGDLIGASPLLSAAFHDEPTIEAMNAIGLDVASVGNHEFDEGWRELRRMQHGGCLNDGSGANGQDSCPGGRQFKGADFKYLGANVVFKSNQKTVFRPYDIFKVDGVKVGFIGMTLEGTDAIVSQAGIQEIDFTDEVETANALVPKLRKKGVKSIIVLLHEGAVPTDANAYNDCTGVTGPAVDIAQRLSPKIDAVVSGHTHLPYNCVVKDPKGSPRLLTSAYSFGRVLTKLHFLIDPKTRDIVRPAAFAHNMIVENDASVRPVKRLVDLISVYKTLVAPIANQVIGHIAPLATPSQSISRTADTSPDGGGDSPLGNLIADAQKADPTVVTSGGVKPVIALMNPGGIRADLLENAAGNITYEAAFTVQPFNNFVVSMDLTGAQIKAILNEQWNGPNESARKILQVSGLDYTWDASEANPGTGNAIVGDVMVDHDGNSGTAMVPLVDGTTYRVVANNFLSDGGDSFPTFKQGTNKLVGGLDIDSLRLWLQANDPFDPATIPLNRISQQP